MAESALADSAADSIHQCHQSLSQSVSQLIDLFKLGGKNTPNIRHPCFSGLPRLAGGKPMLGQIVQMHYLVP